MNLASHIKSKKNKLQSLCIMHYVRNNFHLRCLKSIQVLQLFWANFHKYIKTQVITQGKYFSQVFLTDSFLCFYVASILIIFTAYNKNLLPTADYLSKNYANLLLCSTMKQLSNTLSLLVNYIVKIILYFISLDI